MATIFISDLHLEPEHPELNDFFFRFLRQRAKGAEALYILGDFFEVWVGDDEQLPLHEQVAFALKELGSQGTNVFLMTGNRDFLMGLAFADRCGSTLISEPHVITLYDRRTLLMHGDSLCTSDREYQKFRTMSRNPLWQSMMLNRPLADRQLMARQLRQISQAKNQGKPEKIMDVTPEEVTRVMQQADAIQFIHGHTHRPASHEVALEGSQGWRFVLGDWQKSTVYALADSTGVQLIRLDASELNS